MKEKKTKKTPIAIGIDVAKLTLSVCIRFDNGFEQALTIRNTKTDIKKRLFPLTQNCTAKVVMESTGHYHWESALLLSEWGLDVRVVNPILAKQYTSGNIRKVKTDPQDAKGLCKMALVCEELPERFQENTHNLALKKKFSLLASFSKQLQALKAMMKDFSQTQEILEKEDSTSIKEIQSSIQSLKISIQHLEKECIREAKKDTKTQEQSRVLESIPGVSDVCSILSLSFFHLSKNTTAKSWIAYSGLDVSSRESGTWRGKCKLTKRGNAYLRKRLYCSAWGAVMHNSEFKKYYTDLREKEGKAHVEALVIIARKIVRIMYRLLKENEMFDASKLAHKYTKIESVS